MLVIYSSASTGIYNTKIATYMPLLIYIKKKQ